MHGSITSEPNRDMGTLLRAATGIAVALTLFYGPGILDGLKSQPIRQIRTDIADQQPGAKLNVPLGQLLAPQNGTPSAPNPHRLQAHGLHF
jgi:hypothetical protein